MALCGEYVGYNLAGLGVPSNSRENELGIDWDNGTTIFLVKSLGKSHCHDFRRRGSAACRPIDYGKSREPDNESNRGCRPGIPRRTGKALPF